MKLLLSILLLPVASLLGGLSGCTAAVEPPPEPHDMHHMYWYDTEAQAWKPLLPDQPYCTWQWDEAQEKWVPTWPEEELEVEGE